MSHVKNFGAVGDGRADDTHAIRHCLEKSDGQVVFPRGVYRITQTIEVNLAKLGRAALSGDGGVATLVMDGPGPALRIVGSHTGSAHPPTIKPAVWERERMPTVTQLEVVGNHDLADGIELEGTMQATLAGVLIRRCRYGVHLVKRNRNLLLSHCHLYEGRGTDAIGVYFDGVNLHQANLIGCHISYFAHAGVKIQRSEIRNLQITGCDIEYNHDPAFAAPDSADIWIDAREGTVREATIASCTIQARKSPGGANVRIEGAPNALSTSAGLWTITGNVIQSQSINLLLRNCRGVVVSGNSFCSGHERTAVIERCHNVALGTNTIDYNPDYEGDRVDGVLIRDSSGVVLDGLVLQSIRAGDAENGGAIEVRDSRDVTLANCQIFDPTQRGLHLHNVRDAIVHGCRVAERRTPAAMREAVLLTGSTDPTLAANRFDKGTHGDIVRR